MNTPRPPKEAVARARWLRAAIAAHDRRYYLWERPVIADAEYDALVRELAELERRYPSLASAKSPTVTVRGAASRRFAPVTHRVPMLSLDNTYQPEELRVWVERVERQLGGTHREYIVEPKIDGVSCSLVYRDGVLLTAATRGDGAVGEDITANALTIGSLPRHLNVAHTRVPTLLDIRGEVFLERSAFEELNRELAARGEPVFANPRNAASGSLRQKDPSVTSQRPLQVQIHSFGFAEGIAFTTDGEFLEWCDRAGLPVVQHRRICRGLSQVLDACRELQEQRDAFPYDIDGAVVKLNHFADRTALGTTMKSPRWAIAYKFPARQATTILRNVVFQVGRTGIITPVAELEPVRCGGVTIARATLHNFDEVRRLDIAVGDRVLIERAGEVIPKVVTVTERATRRTPIVPPTHCPSCGQPVVRESREVAYRCVNPLCPAQVVEHIVHFASRSAMDIDGLGDAVAQQLVASGAVRDVADLYRLTAEHLLHLDQFKYRRAHNLLVAIEHSKQRPLSRLIYGLGIRHVGEKAAQILARTFRSWDRLAAASPETLASIEGIGPVIAESVHTFLQMPATGELMERLRRAGVSLEEPVSPPGARKGGIFNGTTVVFTGELATMSRVEAQRIVESLGGTTASSVSRKTGLLVVGAAPGSKLDRARQLGVRIVHEPEFLEMLRDAGVPGVPQSPRP